MSRTKDANFKRKAERWSFGTVILGYGGMGYGSVWEYWVQQ